jgi:hypothetical protein
MTADTSVAGGPHAPIVSAKRTRKRRPTPVGAFRGKGAAHYCGIGFSTWCRLDAAGLVPSGSMVSGCKVWGKRELTRWIDFGCPDRKTWSALWQQLRTK